MNHPIATARNTIGRLRFFMGAAVATTGAALWLADMARLLA